MKTWNDKGNMYGDMIKLLFVTETGAEGLDLKYGRRVHIIEPYWNDSRLEQVIARIVRFGSHEDLPLEKRTVQPFIYISTFPADLDKKPEERTTDEEVFASAVRNQELIRGFRKLLIEASIDCMFNNKSDLVECMSCAPSNKALYHPNIRQDMILPNPCKKQVKKTVNMEEIVTDTGEKFYYFTEKDKVKIYKYSDDLASYVPLEHANPMYSFLVRKILKLGGNIEIEREFEESDRLLQNKPGKAAREGKSKSRSDILACIEFVKLADTEVAIFGNVPRGILEKLFPDVAFHYSPDRAFKCEKVVILDFAVNAKSILEKYAPQFALISLDLSAGEADSYSGKVIADVFGDNAKVHAESPFSEKKYTKEELAMSKGAPVKFTNRFERADYDGAAEIYIIQNYIRQKGQIPEEIEFLAIKGVISELPN